MELTIFLKHIIENICHVMNYEIIIIPNSTYIVNKACGISMPCKKPLLLKVLQKSLK